jgi:DNA uptake protein ComE-like DNA-binding protein
MEKRGHPVTSKPAAEQKTAEADQCSRITNGELLDINSASEKQLMAVKGIGVEYSDRIIAGRPYFNQEQLVTRKIIPREIYEAIKDQIIAKQLY